jgi:hypothetical protein
MKLRKYNLLGVLLISVFILSTSIGVSVATDDDDDGVDDEFEESEKRDIQIEIEPGQIEIESKLRQGSTVDEIEIKVKYDDDDVEIKISYEEEFYSDSENETEFEIEFSVSFRKLIEFVDQNSNGIYEPSADTMIQEVQLNSFQPVVYSTSLISGDTTLHYLFINSTDGVFAAHVYVAEEFTIINETLLTPTETKIDIEISDFNYLDINSQLALYVKLESGAEYETDEETEDEEEGYASEESGVKTISNNFAGFFTWEENAMIDGVSQQVLSSTIEVDDEDEFQQKLYLNYPRGNHIYHDPKVGISALTTSSQSMLPIVIIGGILGLVAAAGIIVIIVRKRNRM